MSPNSQTSLTRRSKSSGPSAARRPAGVAIALSNRRHRVALSSAVWPLRVCLRGSLSPSTQTINRCTDNRPSTHARASSWIAPAWLVGWAHAEHWSLHSSMLYVATCSPAARFTPTTRRCRYLPRAMAIPKPHDCGPMCAMTATLDRWIREPSGLPAHPLGRGFTHSHILRACVACCKPTPRPASVRCSRMAT